MNNKPNLDEIENTKKVELAKSIASRTQTISRSYASVEEGIIRGVKALSTLVDKVIFNPKLTGVVSLVIAVLLYLIVNNGWTVSENLKYQYALGDISITKQYNEEVYEIFGLPSSAYVTISGEMNDIQMAKNNQNYQVVADLSGLTEGTYTIDLVPTNFSERVNVTCSPSTATVTIRKKISWKKNISYDFINTDKMDSKYILGDPEFETSEVIVRASEETVNRIALVKALIDVSNVEGSFEQYATLVAFDDEGNKVDVDMVPSSVKVAVDVTSPNKSVPIVLNILGDLPNGKAIDTVSLDHEAITIYASESVLNSIEQFVVEVDVSEMVADASIVATVKLPSGVKSTSISKVNLEFKLCDAGTRVIENVHLSYKNLPNKYKFEILNPEDAYVNVVVTGSPERITAITADDLEAYVDMSKVTKGEAQLKVICNGSDEYLKYSSEKETVGFNFVE